MYQKLPKLSGRQVLNESRRFFCDFFQAFPKRILLIVALLIFQTLSAGIGILFILPLLSVLGLAGEQAANHPITEYVANAFTTVNIPLNLFSMLVVYLLLIAVVASLRAYSSILSTSVQQQFTHKLRSSMYRLVLRSQWRILNQYPLADLGHLLTGQVAQIGRLGQLTFQFLSNVLLVFGFFAVAVVISWQMSALALLFLVLSSIMLLPLYRRTLRSGTAQLYQNQTLFKAVTEHLHNLRMIKLFGAESRFAAVLAGTSSELEKQQLRLTRINAATTWFLTLFAAFLIAAFFYVSITFLDGDSAELIVLVVVLSRLLPLLSVLQRTVQQVLHTLPASAAARAITREFERVQELLPGKEFTPIELQQALELRDITFRYPGNEQALLDGFSCRIPANAVTAISGPSGVGKSTVADLLAGLQQPEFGDLVVDGRGLSSRLRLVWRLHVAYVVQEPLLFDDTIYNNLCWVRPNVQAADIEQALRDAAAWDFVQSLPHGLNTRVGDHGRALSGGQRQRLAIARALLRKPTLLILDEATNALDQTNEELVIETIKSLRGKLTVVVISHHASINQIADHVVMLEPR